jgi:hypothetical protein
VILRGLVKQQIDEIAKKRLNEKTDAVKLYEMILRHLVESQLLKRLD